MSTPAEKDGGRKPTETTSPEFKDRFGAISHDYALFRPTYPSELFTYVTSQCPSTRTLAVDVGCGTGQVASKLGEYFKNVIGLDGSAGQIAQAREEAHGRPNLRYEVCTAEKLGDIVAPGSVDLITVGQAVHWFDLDTFYDACKKALNPHGGVLAIWTYPIPHFIGNPKLGHAVQEIYEYLHTKGYWDAGARKAVDELYATLPFPFQEILPRQHWPTPPRTWVRSDLDRFLGTWSGMQTAQRQFGVNPVADFAEQFNEAWGPEKEQQVQWEVHLRIGRV